MPHHTEEQIIKIGKEAILNELNSLSVLPEYINRDFYQVIQLILNSSSRVVLTGIGKSAIIGQKITATLNSTGQPALFMHAADAIHGDLGMIQNNDVIIAISKSGNTSEMTALFPLLKKLDNPVIAMIGNDQSFMAKHADYILNTTVDKEACPNNLAPTTSTSAQLMMGDALAITLLKLRNFTGRDFSKFHPGGALGKRLYLTCGDIAKEHMAPKVTPKTPWQEVVVNISENRLGATAVIENENVVGIITDGDMRRMLAKYDNLEGVTASDIMGNNPKILDADILAVDAGNIMQENKITQLIITGDHSYIGMVHLHDLYQHGIIA